MYGCLFESVIIHFAPPTSPFLHLQHQYILPIFIPVRNGIAAGADEVDGDIIGTVGVFHGVGGGAGTLTE